ncbi:MAG TPA: O-antigen ligase family protein [Terriglobales bacterium]|jgi:O-antigen ligase|nr:O-antigen ligase family protein [Terriglobales bacterium]
MAYTQTSPATPFNTLLRVGFFLLLGIVTLLTLRFLPEIGTAEVTIQTCLVGLAFIVLLFVSLARIRSRFADPRVVALGVGVPLWWYLLVLEQLFPRRGTTDMAYAGDFASSAYSEASMWMLIAITVGVLTLRWPAYLKDLFRGPYKWVTLYTCITILSVSYAPRPAFAMAWCGKLTLVVVLLRLCWSAIATAAEAQWFVRLTLWAFLVLTSIPLIEAFTNPEGAFAWGSQGWGRLNSSVHPITVSQWGGILLLLALLAGSLRWRKRYLPMAILGGVAMVISGGKAAAIAGIISAILMFVFQGRGALAVKVTLVLAVAGTLLVLVSPFGTHLRTYSSSGLALTLTGRTDLWAGAMGDIRSHLLLGNGYMSSRFVNIAVEDMTWDAGHMHNGFLEVLYNNGLLGLFPMLMILWSIVKNTMLGVRRGLNPTIKILAAGCLSLTIYLLLNGLVEATFGGRVTSFFMLLLMLLPFSEFVGSQTVPQTVSIPVQHPYEEACAS